MIPVFRVVRLVDGAGVGWLVFDSVDEHENRAAVERALGPGMTLETMTPDERADFLQNLETDGL